MSNSSKLPDERGYTSSDCEPKIEPTEPPELQKITHYAEWCAAHRILYPQNNEGLRIPPRLIPTSADTRPNREVAADVLEGLIGWVEGRLDVAVPQVLTYPYLTRRRLHMIIERNGIPEVEKTREEVYDLLLGREPKYALAPPTLQDTVTKMIVDLKKTVTAMYELDSILD
ncbi:MAG: hypothetical protein Q8R53_00100 [Nanoarchaeota archaeon]|nr:hypothetical protein [Nanoarchaeota archaeon]